MSGSSEKYVIQAHPQYDVPKNYMGGHDYTRLQQYNTPSRHANPPRGDGLGHTAGQTFTGAQQPDVPQQADTVQHSMSPSEYHLPQHYTRSRRPLIPHPTGGPPPGFIPPSVQQATGASSPGFVPPIIPPTTGASSFGFIPSDVPRPTSGSSSGFVPPRVPRSTGASSSGFIPPGVQQATSISSSGFIPPGVSKGMGNSLSASVSGVQRTRDAQPVMPNFTGYRRPSRTPDSVVEGAPRVVIRPLTDGNEPKVVPVALRREPAPPPPSPLRPAIKGKDKGKKR